MKGSSLIFSRFIYNYPHVESSYLIFKKQTCLSEPHQTAKVASCVPPHPALLNLKYLKNISVHNKIIRCCKTGAFAFLAVQ